MHTNSDPTGALAGIRRFFRGFAEARRRAADLRDMQRLDRHTLRDIGMSRAELVSVCFGDSADRRRSAR